MRVSHCLALLNDAGFGVALALAVLLLLHDCLAGPRASLTRGGWRLTLATLVATAAAVLSVLFGCQPGGQWLAAATLALAAAGLGLVRMQLPRNSRAAVACLQLALLLVALAIRVHGLTQQPVWFDETVYILFAQMDPEQWLSNPILWVTAPALNPLLRAWIWLVGPSEPALRALFALCGAASVPLCYALCRRWIGATAALVAALLLAVNPAHIYYSRQVSEYGLIPLAAMGSFWLWRRCLDAPRPGRAAALGLFNLLALAIHPTFVYIPLVQLVLSGLRKPRLLKASSVNLVPVVLMGAVALWFLSHPVVGQRVLQWAPPLEPKQLLGTALWFSQGSASHGTYLWESQRWTGALVLPALLALIGLGIATLRRQHRAEAPDLLHTLLLWLAGPLALHLLFCLLRGRLWMGRYVLAVLPALAALAAVGLTRLLQGGAPRRLLAGLATACLLALMLAATWDRPVAAGFKQLARRLTRQLSPGDGVVVSPWYNLLPLGYHTDQSVGRWDAWRLRLCGRAAPTQRWLVACTVAPDARLDRLPHFDGWVQGKRRIWAVVTPDWPGDVQTAPLLRRLQSMMQRTRVTPFPFDGAELQLYTRRGTSSAAADWARQPTGRVEVRP